MYLYLNRYSHIISINERETYIRKNRNGIIVPCDKEDAYGMIDDSGDHIYYLGGKGYTEEYTDIFAVVEVNEIPSEVVPRKFSYINGEFVRNEEYEDTVKDLTVYSTENDDAICDLAEMDDVNSTAIDDLAEMLDELSNRIAALEAQNG